MKSKATSPTANAPALKKPAVKQRSRCYWCGEDPLYVAYHDDEWGVPEHDDARLFEKLILDGFQAGLSWITILKKRENFRAAFHKFDAQKIAKMGKRDVKRLMKDAGIVRNRLKIEGTIKNAKAYFAIREEFGSFDRYLWQFVGGKTIRLMPRPKRGELRATSPESDAMSKDLRKRGFTFVGSTICYAFMQAVGMVDDHAEECFRSRAGKRASTIRPRSR